MNKVEIGFKWVELSKSSDGQDLVYQSIGAPRPILYWPGVWVEAFVHDGPITLFKDLETALDWAPIHASAIVKGRKLDWMGTGMDIVRNLLNYRRQFHDLSVETKGFSLWRVGYMPNSEAPADARPKFAQDWVLWQTFWQDAKEKFADWISASDVVMDWQTDYGVHVWSIAQRVHKLPLGTVLSRRIVLCEEINLASVIIDMFNKLNAKAEVS